MSLTYDSIIDVLSKAELCVAIDFSPLLGPLPLIPRPSFSPFFPYYLSSHHVYVMQLFLVSSAMQIREVLFHENVNFNVSEQANVFFGILSTNAVDAY